MPQLAANAYPSYHLHKQSGQAVVTLDGRDICLGVHGTEASKAEYDGLIAEWLANGHRLPPANAPGSASGPTVAELIADFWHHAEGYYKLPGGGQSKELESYRQCLRPLKKLYGATPAAALGPLALKAVREGMVKLGWCRTHVNKQVNRLRTVFKWAVENERVPAAVHHGLRAVSGLKRGKSEAPEGAPVTAVPEPFVEAVLRWVSGLVAAMARLQLVTGMRPGEVCSMRGCDLDVTGKLWLYQPAHHKAEYHGHERTVYLGRRAQEIIRPFLKADLAAHLFSPAEAAAGGADPGTRDALAVRQPPGHAPGREAEAGAGRRLHGGLLPPGDHPRRRQGRPVGQGG